MSATQTQDLPFAGSPLLSNLAEGWWLLLLRGFAAIAFGALAFFWPGITLLSLVLLWGIYAAADGVIALVTAFSGDNAAPRGWLIFSGIVGIGAGVTTFVWPGTTAFVLLMLIAAWAIVIGAMMIWASVQLRKVMPDAWLFILNGVLSIAFGVLMFARPNIGGLALVYTIGAYAVIVGCSYLVLSFRLKQYKTPD